jgi:hypothetical protein
VLHSTRLLPSKLVVVAALFCLASMSGACVAVPSSPSQPNGAPQNAPPTPEFSTTQVPSGLQAAPEPVAAGDCPGLDSTLAGVVASADPLAQAEQSLLTVKNGKIQVVLVLSQEDTGFLKDYDVEVGTQLGTQVQAFVPPGQLCDLAKTDEVLAINLPAQAVTQ